MDHFHNPRNAGELPGATARVEVTNPVCGDVLQLAARVEGGRIAELRFKARGCVTAMACASAITVMVAAKSLEEARAISPSRLAEEMGGLPPATTHGAQLACDALQALLRELG